MQIFSILLAVAVAAVVVVLLVGVFGMAQGGSFNRKYGNRLMRLRVLLQAVAIVLFLLFVLTATQG